MFRLVLTWLVATAASSAWADQGPAVKQIPGTIMTEFESRPAMQAALEKVRNLGGEVRHSFDSDVFLGFSAQFANESQALAVVADMKQEADVLYAGPVSATTVAGGETPENPKQRERRAENWQNRDHHIATQVDKMHAAGYSGKGVKIAVVDSGINWDHPAFGSCSQVGPECRIVTSKLISKSFKGRPIRSKKDLIGHGTEVASIAAGHDSQNGFVGVAPNATIAAYRIIVTSGTLEQDAMMAGWLEAYKDGANIIVSSTGNSNVPWSQGPVARLISGIVAKGVPCFVGFGNNDFLPFSGLDSSQGRGVMGVNGAGNYYARGPTLELDIKPQVMAPSDYIPVAEGSGYGLDSGSSFAAPIAAGIAALLGEAKGSFDPKLINGLLMSTAKRRPGEPVTRQGAGLVQAWDALQATTLLDPPSLAFNDTHHRVASIGLNITNMLDSEVVYSLSNEPAEMDNVGEDKTNAAAIVTLSQNSVTLGPHESVIIDIAASDPPDLGPIRVDPYMLNIPIWSGWINITATPRNGTQSSFNVPYLGAAGSLRAHSHFGGIGLHEGCVSSDIKDCAYVVPYPPSVSRPSVVPDDSLKLPEGGIKELPQFRMSTSGTSELRIYVVPLDLCLSPSDPRRTGEGIIEPRASAPMNLTKACVPESSTTTLPGGVPTLGEAAGSPMRYVGNLFSQPTFEWNGGLASGQFVPAGPYQLYVEMLDILGDANNASHWKSAKGPEVTIAYDYSQAAPLNETSTA